MKKLLYTLVLAFLGLLFASTAARADEDTHLDRRGQGSQLEGSWWLYITRAGGLAPIVAMQTYTGKGEMIGSSSTTSSTSHGNWVQTGPRRYTLTSYSLRFNAQGQHASTSRVTINIRLVGPDEYRSVHQFELFDLAGTRTELRYDTGVGRRLPIVHSPQQP